MTFKPDQFNQVKDIEEQKPNQVLEQERGTLENLGEDIIELGEEIKKHPPLKRLKEIAKKFGKDIMGLFSIIKKEEKETEVQKESDSEKIPFKEKLKNSLKTMVSYGMYALVLTGNNACTEEVHNEQPKQPEKITSTIKVDESKIIEGVGEEKQGYTYYDKSVFDDFDTFYEYVKKDKYFLKNLDSNDIKDDELKKSYYKDLYETITENIKEIEKIKNDELEKIMSDDYLNKLAKELNTNTKEAEKIRDERLKRLINMKYYISNHESSSEDSAYGDTTINHENPKIYFAYNLLNYNIETIRHEIQHAILGEEEDIPKATQNKVLNNFKKENFNNEKEIKYLYDPHEILARKAVFEEMLEQFNIKKYGEKFTIEHYKKVKKLMESKNTLDGNQSIIDDNANTREFFRMFERDALIMIMNTVAYQDAMEKGVPIEQGKVAEELVAKILKVNELNKQGDTYYPPEFFVNNNIDVS